jgi:hypothetical protein
MKSLMFGRTKQMCIAPSVPSSSTLLLHLILSSLRPILVIFCNPKQRLAILPSPSDSLVSPSARHRISCSPLGIALRSCWLFQALHSEWRGSNEQGEPPQLPLEGLKLTGFAFFRLHLRLISAVDYSVLHARYLDISCFWNTPYGRIALVLIFPDDFTDAGRCTPFASLVPSTPALMSNSTGPLVLLTLGFFTFDWSSFLC